MTLDEFRVLYIDELTERFTDPGWYASPWEVTALQDFSDGKAMLPSHHTFLAFVAWLLQRERVVNRHELYDQVLNAWFK